VESESAREKLAARMERAEREEDQEEEAKRAEKAPKPRREKAPAPAEGGAEALGKFLKSRQGKSLERQVMRGVFGMLKKRL
jgi:hypothetical protein